MLFIFFSDFRREILWVMVKVVPLHPLFEQVNI